MARIDSIKASITEVDDREALSMVRTVRESRVTFKKTINRRSPTITKAIKSRDKMDKMMKKITPEMAESLLKQLQGRLDGSGTT